MKDQTAASDPQKWREVYSTKPDDYYADTISVSDEGAVRLGAGDMLARAAGFVPPLKKER